MLRMFFFQFLYHHLVIWSTCSSFCRRLKWTKIICRMLWYFPVEENASGGLSVWYLIVHIIPFLCLIVLFWNILDLLVSLVLWLFFSTLVIGGAGSLMLDLYGWESVFYVSGVLSVLWAYCMWKYLLKGEGKWGDCVCESDYQTGKTSLDSCTLKGALSLLAIIVPAIKQLVIAKKAVSVRGWPPACLVKKLCADLRHLSWWAHLCNLCFRVIRYVKGKHAKYTLATETAVPARSWSHSCLFV